MYNRIINNCFERDTRIANLRERWYLYMKNILFLFVTIIITFTGCCRNEKSAVFEVKPEYVPIEELLKCNLVKNIRDDLYCFPFENDSLPYVIQDSVFKLILKDNFSILYYNSSLYKNNGYIIYSDYNKKRAEVFMTNRIENATGYYMSNNTLFRIKEAVEPPFINQYRYFIFTPFEFSSFTNFSVISEGAYLLPDSITNIFNPVVSLKIQDSILYDKIMLKGTINGIYFNDSVIIDNSDFIASKQLIELRWDSLKILQRKGIWNKTMTIK